MTALLNDTADDDSAYDISTRAMRGGWMLRGLLLPDASPAQCRQALRMAYQAIRWSQAGLALSSDANELLLMQWQTRLPSAELMHQHVTQFRQGVHIWREAWERSQSTHAADRKPALVQSDVREHRIRQAILGARAALPPKGLPR